MLSFIIWLILGFLAGWIAKMLMPGPDGGGTIMTIILGMVGAIVGGFVANLFGYPMAHSTSNLGASVPSFIFSIIGAIVILGIYRLATGRRVTA
jgi:uncharacterized membrane protein YeaQ/YmgE (transglycosylase-associated protein family)